MSTDSITWIKSTKSADEGNCVELGADASAVYLRDSKNQQGPVLTCAPAGVAAWIHGAKRNEFDRLSD
ncbi:DUF397 domain-containing protein [Kineosporia babensis]|uniref:DUF397 domain-containing protein n=1 Tax=Kineosporia babensis TaxID=499548 RepID=A0A9X1ND09_9ACTN|nr:DUF397 domain-containing protein [Kineosporia babensis]MCD5312727.1 DUF397 domain-containing protein [Kineosporia babensis]